MMMLSLQFSSFSYHSSLCKSKMLLSTLVSNTFILFSILNTEDLHSPPLPITELLNPY